MKVFATGASGWVGSHVTPLLLKAGHQVTAAARSDASAKKLEDQGVTVIRAGLEDTDALHKAAGEADAVIHMAYIHDFSDYGGKPAQIDYAAIRAMASALEGTNKPIIITSGIPVAPIHNIAETDAGTTGPRAEGENVAISYADKGVRPIIIRLPFTVHGDGDHGFISFAAGLAAKTGVAAYVGDGSNTWPAVHVKDAAEVYKRAVENDKLPGGTRLHAVQDTGVPFKQIAEVIGKRTGAEVKSVSKEEAGKYLEWLAYFASMSVEPQSKLTREWLGGWEPKEKPLLEDLETSTTYFAKKA
ncbi:hypothetical protein IAT38_001692 [Cryptococcus sp. DSM 104549]